jgi:hypothetical protein
VSAGLRSWYSLSSGFNGAFGWLDSQQADAVLFEIQKTGNYRAIYKAG